MQLPKKTTIIRPPKAYLNFGKPCANKEKKINNVDISPEQRDGDRGHFGRHPDAAGRALVEKGDEILFPGPTYPPYISYTKFFDGTPVAYETIEEEGWVPNIDDLRSKISTKTRAIVIINPNNPTGSVYDEKNPQRND